MVQNNVTKIKKIGISGGTFDPVHCGHLIAAQEIRERLKLDKVLFIPVGLPPHKKDHRVTEAEHRYNMVFEAVRSNPFFEVSRIEIDREGYTYTIDTLQYLKTVYGDDARLFFIIGADVVPELVTWRQFEEIFRLCEFVAVNRPGTQKKDFFKNVRYLKEQYSAIIHIIKLPLIEISSTDIRRRVKEGRTIKYLVPESVEKYIYENGLYR
ncbi:MAG TPA: nicotinate-nucleotide adenylyltransferase [Clostridiaceae bacterium]|nr:nicotinate-nucleotide adenylyltransferase [Clostridiaceae bacterium]